MALLNEADAVMFGDLAADQVYAGDALVWPSGPPPGLMQWTVQADPAHPPMYNRIGIISAPPNLDLLYVKSVDLSGTDQSAFFDGMASGGAAVTIDTGTDRLVVHIRSDPGVDGQGRHRPYYTNDRQSVLDFFAAHDGETITIRPPDKGP